METANVWHVSSFSLDVHLPSLLFNKFKQLTVYPERRHKRDVSNGLGEKQKKLSGKMALASALAKLLAFCPRGDISIHSAWSRKPGKRKESS